MYCICIPKTSHLLLCMCMNRQGGFQADGTECCGPAICTRWALLTWHLSLTGRVRTLQVIDGYLCTYVLLDLWLFVYVFIGVTECY
jgi:hypothetical protein